jgi:two-component system sensor histidine kinase RstB
LAILLIVIVAGVSSFGLVAHINQKQQRHTLMGGMLLLAADQIKADNGNITPTRNLLTVPLAITPFHKADLSRIEMERLRYGALLQRVDAQGVLHITLSLTIQEVEHVLTGKFADIRSHHIRGVVALIQRMLQRDPMSLTHVLNRHSHSESLPVRILSDKEVQTLTLQKHHMVAPMYESRISIGGNQEQFFSYLPEIERYIELGPYAFHQGLSLPSLLVVIGLSIILAGIAVYWLVHRFELNLQHLERATTRIASGHLHSRVKVNSSDAFGRLGKAFNRMAEQIHHLMGVQKEMIRAVSHELRTPVARMRFGVQMMEDSTEDPYLKKQVQDMDQDLQELDELVDEILTYARLEEGGPILEFKSANLLDLIDQVVLETRRRTDKVDIQWHSQTMLDEHVFSDIEYRYMHRAIQNLVGNACRYAKKKVCLEFSFDNDICRIDVEDDGEGIPEKDWDRVFSPFTRLDDSRTRASGGYGLGLSIVRRIIYWHGGTALVGESRWGGAKMSLLWPKSHQTLT